MTLVIENVKDEFLPAFKGLAKTLNVKCKIQKSKQDSLEQEILLEREQIKKQIQSGNARIFKNHQEFKQALQNGEI